MNLSDVEGSDVCLLKNFSRYLTTGYKKNQVRLCNTVLLARGQILETGIPEYKITLVHKSREP